MLEFSKKVYENMRNYYLYVFKAKNNFGISKIKSIKMKLKGFTPDHYTLYELDKNNPKEYFTEMDRWATRKVNGYYRFILDDKLMFYEMFHQYLNIPKNLFWITNGSFLKMDGTKLNRNDIKKIIKEHKSIFMKPVKGGEGRGVYNIRYDQNYYLNDKKMNIQDLLSFLQKEENVVATKTIEQHNYAKEVYPKSVNTIRVITTYNNATNKANIPDAMHRFGSTKTGFIDNVSSGGLFAVIDVKTGVLSEAKNYQNESYTHHPDTNKKISGMKVPYWEELKETCLEIAERFPYIPYMSWDVVITEDTFYIIEINTSTGLTLLQMQGGKKDSELGKFLKSTKLVK